MLYKLCHPCNVSSDSYQSAALAPMMKCLCVKYIHCTHTSTHTNNTKNRPVETKTQACTNNVRVYNLCVCMCACACVYMCVCAYMCVLYLCVCAQMATLIQFVTGTLPWEEHTSSQVYMNKQKNKSHAQNITHA